MLLPTLKIGPYSAPNPLVAAPMAGVTDRPFRQLSRRLGAGLAVAEMLTSDTRLWDTRKSRLRMDHQGEVEPIWVQIAGADPAMMARAAQLNVANGAQLIDINMGCPAKKVCNVLAGSALLEDEPLVARIVSAVVAAVDVPVTLKIRTGPHPNQRNALRIAQLAQDCGIAALSVHGRTRAEKYQGQAEYETIAQIRETIAIPLIANGDLDGPDKAREVLRQTGADGLMIGRASQGNPWIFRELLHFLQTGQRLPGPPVAEVRDVMLEHLRELHQFYGAHCGLRVARKHIGWYLRGRPDASATRARLMRIEHAEQQLDCLREYFDGLQSPPAALAALTAAR